MDLSDAHSIRDCIIKYKPDYFINFAAQSFVAGSWEYPVQTWNTDANAVLDILESIRKFSPKCRFYNAGSSEEFGDVVYTPQDEKHPLKPRSPYGAAKIFAHHMTNHYREAYDLFACCGILFNHESPLRGIEFVTRQITYRLARVKYNIQKKFPLGNIYARRDWGFAGDYVEAMWLMLQQKQPDDYVIATGESHSVEEFLTLATQYADLGDWKDIVTLDKQLLRPSDIDELIGDPTKAQRVLNWKPKMKFEDLVKSMVEYDLEYIKLQTEPFKTK